MSLELELAVRFLRRRGKGLLRGTALAALSGVALATASLVITLAVMTGYRQAIATALQRGNAQMIAFAPRPLSLDAAAKLVRVVKQVPGVKAADPVMYVSGLLQDPREPSNPLVVVLKAVQRPPPYTGLSTWPSRGPELPAVLGYRLAARMGVKNGAIVHVLIAPKAGSLVLPSVTCRVAGTFHLQFSEFDEQWMIVPLGRLLHVLPGAGATGLEIALDDPMDARKLRPAVERALPGLIVTDWFDMNPALFAALKWQTLSLFIVLSLVAAVASFQVSSALVIVSVEKRKTSGALQAMGAPPRLVRRVLMLVGCMLGGAGALAGIGFGWIVSLVMTHFRLLSFPPGLAKVYMVEFIPLRVTPLHLAAVVAVSTVIIAFASWWPARQAARMDPVTALRSV
ncbi:MAG: ABC transporter permease [Acidobacteria bacterium]|nr:ABC transporter permease [Acidobacteriota bacterium]